MEYYDVLLVNPPWSELGEALEHLGLGYMASCLRKRGIKVKILDATVLEWGPQETIEEIERTCCKMIGISIPFQEAAGEILNFVNEVRSKDNVHICVGGIYPSFAWEELMKLCPSIDTIVIGEGEETIVELAECIINNGDLGSVKGIAYRGDNNQIKRNESRKSIENLDDIPFPARDTLPALLKEKGFATMITSRGCYCRCSFCSVVPFYQSCGFRYRMRSCENVMQEIELLYNQYGVRNIMFNDANFIGGSKLERERAKAIAEEIIKRKLDLEFRIQCRANDVDEELFALLKKAGLTRVYVGIESGSQTMLDRFQKDITVEQNLNALRVLRKLDLFVSMGFIMFDDRITINELTENVNFIKKVKQIIPDNKLGHIYPISKVLPLSGTSVEKYMLENKKYLGNSINFDYKFEDPIVNVIYKFLNVFVKLIWSFQKITGKKADTYKNWSGGWRTVRP